MKYSDLLRDIQDNCSMNVPSTVIKGVMDAAILCITDEVSRGEDVSLPDLGKFSRGHRQANVGRNPQTGEAVDIPARNTVKFKPASGFKKLVNN